ncbi:hypothetical protein [Luteolibacter arcticus]|uniref:hypothetical protein n=1 Tax=Luteolibacter arcticus TaxID=1581411 RepID=UPI0022235160|nr:hypothetical protein [Luteolibacter arcticus]
MKRNSLTLGALMALSMGCPLHAAAIVWDTPVTISGSDDVSTNGTQVFGRNIAVAYPGATAMVNGANFGYNNSNWAITFADTATSTAAGFAPITVGGPDGSNYAAILNNSRFGSGAAAITFTLGNLTLGQQYELQFWVNDYRGFPNDRTETISATGGGNTNVNTPTLSFLDSNGPVHGQWVIGVWTADTTSLTFSVQGNETSQYNALQVRAIPEAGAAVLGAFGVLALLRRRRI